MERLYLHKEHGRKVAVMLSALTMGNYKRGSVHTWKSSTHREINFNSWVSSLFFFLFSNPFKSRHNVALVDLKGSDFLESFLAWVCSGGLSTWLSPQGSRKLTHPTVLSKEHTVRLLKNVFVCLIYTKSRWFCSVRLMPTISVSVKIFILWKKKQHFTQLSSSYCSYSELARC